MLDLVAGDYVELYANPGNQSDWDVSSSATSTRFSLSRLDSGGNIGGAAIGAKIWNSGTQTVSTSTLTELAFDEEDFDTDGFHDTGSNTERMTIPAGLGGTYIVHANTGSHTAAGSDDRIRFIVNGTTIPSTQERFGGLSSSVNFSTSAIVNLNSGDYIETQVYQTSGGDLSYGDASERRDTSEFSIVRLDAGGGGGPAIGVSAYHNTTQSLSDETETSLNMNSENFDTDGYHDNSTNNTRLTVPVGLGGTYLLTNSTYTNGESGGFGLTKFRKNGTTDLPGTARYSFGATTGYGFTFSTVVDLVAGDYVEFQGYQDTTGAQDFGSASEVEAQTTANMILLDSQDGCK